MEAMPVDFLAVGDVVVDDFIRLKDAEVHCAINHEACTICMRFGDKVPFESSTVVYGVGNAGNAAVAAARLGLKSGILTNIGKDQNGEKILESYKHEGIDTSLIAVHEGIRTNYHYVLWYGDERTILVKQNEYPYQLPQDLAAPKTIYFSSIGNNPPASAFRDALIEYLEAHREIFFAFQPGVFDIQAGAASLKRLYARTDFYVLNKEEAARVLGLSETGNNPEALARGIQKLGPKIVIVTSGLEGAYALQDDTFFHVPVYPDPAPPLQRTGAGDAFASTTVAYLSGGMMLKDAMRRGAINSAYVVQKIGAQAGLLEKRELEKLAAA